jgi:DNA-binding NarL/FixJ family response regulator
MTMRCLIVDDNDSFLATAGMLLEREGVALAGAASTGAEAFREVERLQPDVVLVDINLGNDSGFDIARRLVEDLVVAATVILISTHDAEDFIELIAQSPAAGFLPKVELSATAIRRLLAGRHG